MSRNPAGTSSLITAPPHRSSPRLSPRLASPRLPLPSPRLASRRHVRSRAGALHLRRLLLHDPPASARLSLEERSRHLRLLDARLHAPLRVAQALHLRLAPRLRLLPGPPQAAARGLSLRVLLLHDPRPHLLPQQQHDLPHPAGGRPHHLPAALAAQDHLHRPPLPRLPQQTPLVRPVAGARHSRLRHRSLADPHAQGGQAAGARDAGDARRRPLHPLLLPLRVRRHLQREAAQGQALRLAALAERADVHLGRPLQWHRRVPEGRRGDETGRRPRRLLLVGVGSRRVQRAQRPRHLRRPQVRRQHRARLRPRDRDDAHDEPLRPALRRARHAAAGDRGGARRHLHAAVQPACRRRLLLRREVGAALCGGARRRRRGALRHPREQAPTHPLRVGRRRGCPLSLATTAGNGGGGGGVQIYSAGSFGMGTVKR